LYEKTDRSCQQLVLPEKRSGGHARVKRIASDSALLQFLCKPVGGYDVAQFGIVVDQEGGQAVREADIGVVDVGEGESVEEGADGTHENHATGGRLC
jgi:hypothetical protein